MIIILGARSRFIKVESVNREISKNKQVILLYYSRTKKILENLKLNLYGGGKASENIIKELLSFV